MPLTTLDANTALIVIDLQKGLAGLLPDSVVANCRALAVAFRKAGLPVVLVTADAVAPGRTERDVRLPATLPEGFADPIVELGRGADDILVVKRTWGAFASTDLEQKLKGRGVTQVIVTGVATGQGVESTARQAYEAGFNVTLAVDAMADPRHEVHEASIANIFPRLGETGATADIVGLLEGLG